MTDSDHNDLPPDPDMDHLPPTLAAHDGPLTVWACDSETDEWSASRITREDVVYALADLRRQRADAQPL